jgi:ATP-binding protein involved in chromosome partitioning
LAIRESGDAGQPAVIDARADAYGDAFREIARRLAARVSVMEYA